MQSNFSLKLNFNKIKFQYKNTNLYSLETDIYYQLFCLKGAKGPNLLLFTIKSAIHLTLIFHYRFLVSTFFLHRQTPRKNSVTQNMSTLIVPATIPSVSEDCEQLRKAFEGLPLLTLSTSFARVCVFF